MTQAERFSIAASLLAVVVAGATTYFQFFWKHEDFRVQWFLTNNTPFPSMVNVPPRTTGDHGTIKVQMSPSMVLMNRGNQNVIVTEIALILLYSKGADPANVWTHGTNPALAACEMNAAGAVAPWETITLQGKREEPNPMVIEPGKSVPLRVYFRELEELVAEPWTNGSEVTTCFSFMLFDMDGRLHERTIPALILGTGGGRGDERGGAAILLD